jgi:hypothetical protein
MLLVHAFVSHTGKQLVERLLTPCDALVYTDWKAFEDAAPGAAVLVCIVDAQQEVSAQALTRLRLADPSRPVVLCGPKQLAVDSGLGMDVLVDPRRLRTRLPSCVRHHLFLATRAHALEVIVEGNHHLIIMRKPIAEWLVADPVPRLVGSAAKRIGRPLATLERVYRAEVGSVAGTTLKRCVDSIVLYRACEILAKERTLERTAAIIGCSARTLRRMARRAWGVEGKELTDIAPDRALSLLLKTLGLAD